MPQKFVQHLPIMSSCVLILVSSLCIIITCLFIRINDSQQHASALEILKEAHSK